MDAGLFLYPTYLSPSTPHREIDDDDESHWDLHALPNSQTYLKPAQSLYPFKLTACELIFLYYFLKLI